MKEKKSILSISKQDFKNSLDNIPDFRLKQINNWLYKNFTFFPSEMTNLPKSLRKFLSDNYTWEYPKIIKRIKASDKTEKFLLELSDGDYIEFVIIVAPDRKTFCLSTQIGCPIQCRFCSSGALGIKRNLFSEEIVSQFLIGSEQIGKHPDNIVFMGIGEPLLNFKNLTLALDKICSPEYLNYAARRITISTSGIPKKIIRLADLKKQWNLAVSIHAPDDKTRALLIPDKLRFSLKEIFGACKYYFEKTGRIITFQYTLIKNINDQKEHAQKLARIVKQIRAKVNIIRYNQTPQSGFSTPSEKTCSEFQEILEKNQVRSTLRIEKGSQINAACGQLRIENYKK